MEDNTPPMPTWKTVVMIFVLFLIVVSSPFIDQVVARFRGAVEGRRVTTRGSLIQGVFLTLFYLASVGLSRIGVV